VRSAQRVVEALTAYGIQYLLGEREVTRSLAEPGVTIIDVVVDYSRNTELFAELRDDVLE
jgi:hypothetical protein